MIATSVVVINRRQQNHPSTIMIVIIFLKTVFITYLQRATLIMFHNILHQLSKYIKIGHLGMIVVPQLLSRQREIIHRTSLGEVVAHIPFCILLGWTFCNDLAIIESSWHYRKQSAFADFHCSNFINFAVLCIE